MGSSAKWVSLVAMFSMKVYPRKHHGWGVQQDNYLLWQYFPWKSTLENIMAGEFSKMVIHVAMFSIKMYHRKHAGEFSKMVMLYL